MLDEQFQGLVNRSTAVQKRRRRTQRDAGIPVGHRVNHTRHQRLVGQPEHLLQ